MGFCLRHSAASRPALPHRIGRRQRSIRSHDRGAVGSQSPHRAAMAQPLSSAGFESLWEIAPGRGRKPSYGAEKIQEIIDTTLQSKPKGRTQWSCRLLAQRIGVCKSTVNNIWRSHNLKPHRVKTFKLSRDPHFLEKLTDVVG